LTSPRLYDFERDALEQPPSGFTLARTGVGREGKWVVRAEDGGRVLAQLDEDDTDYRFPLAIADAPVLKNVRAQVRCRPIEGDEDRSCGLVVRYQDQANYYVARANVLESDVRFYRVIGGKRLQLDGRSGDITSGVWHTLRIDAKDDHFEVYWDDEKVIDNVDRSFVDPGKAGVWTKTDSVTEFDDLSIAPL
jgi:hypothetical protein